MTQPDRVIVVDDHDDAEAYVQPGKTHYAIADVDVREDGTVVVVLDYHRLIHTVRAHYAARAHQTPRNQRDR